MISGAVLGTFTPNDKTDVPCYHRPGPTNGQRKRETLTDLKEILLTILQQQNRSRLQLFLRNNSMIKDKMIFVF
jgi:hypothetical protein